MKKFMRVFSIVISVFIFCISVVFAEVVNDEIDHPIYGKAIVEKFYDDKKILRSKATYTTDQAFTDGNKELGQIIYYDESGDLSSEGDFIRKNAKESIFGYAPDRVKHGPWLTYKNGELASKLNFKEGRNHGPYTIFHDNGEVSHKGQHSKGQETGIGHYYFNNGQLHKSVEYVEGKAFNVVAFFDKDGVKANHGSFKDGNGTIEIYDSNTGVINNTYTYEDGIAKNVETRIIKTDKGNVTQKTYKNRDGATREIKSFLDGQLEGLQQVYNYKGLLTKTTNYSNGLKHGLETKFNDDGTLFYMNTYVNGVKNGPYKFTPEGYKDKYYALDEGFYDEMERKTGQFKRYLTHREGLVASSTVDGSYQRWLLASGEYLEGEKTGVWTEFYEDGLVTKQTTYRDSTNPIFKEKEYFVGTIQVKLHTEYDRLKERGWKKEYYPSGQLQIEADYKNLKRDGEFKEFHENGNLWEVGQYKDGKKIGRWKVYSFNGLILNDSIYTDVSSALKFKEIEYDYSDDGKLESIVTRDNLKKNETDGVYRYNDVIYQRYNIDNGALKEVETKKVFVYANGKDYTVKHGLYQLYTSEGEMKKEGHYNKGEKNEVWKYYDLDGNLQSLITYVDGDERGAFEKYKYFDNGLKSESAVGVRLEKKKSESLVYFYENGETKETGNYLRIYGEGSRQQGREGEWKSYYENGELKSVGRYLKGFKQGRWTYYHADKVVESTGSYLTLKDKTASLIKKLGKEAKDGVWKYYDESGKLKEKTTFKISNDYEYLAKDQKKYYDNGNLKANDFFRNEKEVGTHMEYFETGELSAKYSYGDGGLCLTERFYLSGVLKTVVESSCLASVSKVKVKRDYFENEQLQLEVTYDDYGDVFNVLQYFNIDGQALEVGSLKDGYGTFNQYDDDNNIIDVETYDYGELVE